jgi:hypothetical protein
MCHILLAGYEDVPSFLNQWKLIERPQMIKMKPYLVYNSKLISQVKTVYSMPMQYICAIFSSEYGLERVVYFDLRGYKLLNFYEYMYVFSIIACCLIYHAIQTKSVTRRTQ